MIPGAYLWIFTTFVASAHPLKISVANLTYDLEKKEYVLDLRVFLDDYLVVNGVLDSEADFNGSLALLPQRRDVRKYLAKHFILYFNGREIEMKVDQVRTEDMTIYVSFKIEESLPTEDILSIKVRNSIFVEQFNDQRNILHVKLPGQERRSILCNAHDPEGVLAY